jgi:hypothetical protein
MSPLSSNFYMEAEDCDSAVPLTVGILGTSKHCLVRLQIGEATSALVSSCLPVRLSEWNFMLESFTKICRYVQTLKKIGQK